MTNTQTLERTLVILKPDALKRGYVDQIIARFEQSGFTIIARKKLRPEEVSEQIEAHLPMDDDWALGMGTRAWERMRKKGIDPAQYFERKNELETGKKIIRGCREYYRSGPFIALVLQGPRVVGKIRKLIGSALVSQAAKGTIRGDFGIPEKPIDLKGGAAQNLVHASDSLNEADREFKCWFTEEEIRILGLLNLKP